MNFHKITIALLCFLLAGSLFAAQRADSFIITAFSDHYKVLAPIKKGQKLSIIIENKLLVDLVGRVESSKGALLANIRIPSGDYRTLDLDLSYDKEVYTFIPLSPAFQAVTLQMGQEAYEIPAKR